MSEARSFVICGWSLDKDVAIKELIKLADNEGDNKTDEELAELAITGGWFTDGKEELKIVTSMGKVIIGKLISSGFGNTLPYSILSFERLCEDMDMLIRHFNIGLGVPSIHTGMTETVIIGGKDEH